MLSDLNSGVKQIKSCVLHKKSLSGGEAQRASLARAFALEPEVLSLDEPCSALDFPTRRALLNDMGEPLKTMNMTALLVTHDYTEIPFLASYVCVLFNGKIMKKGTVQEVFGESIFHRQCMVPVGAILNWIVHGDMMLDIANKHTISGEPTAI